jgi:predicted GNAT family N-acyltransferase
MNVEIEKIDFLSTRYFQSLDVRYNVLRKPLNLQFKPTDLSVDKDSELFVAKVENRVVGTLILTQVSNESYKMRQVAVLADFAKNGIGGLMVKHCENYVLENYKNHIELNARKSALSFYLKLGYSIVSDEFYEVNIPHYKMKKELLS